MAGGGLFCRNFYRKMHDSRRRVRFPAVIWASLKRVAMKSMAMYVGRRRLLAGWVRRVVWASLDLKRRALRAAKARKERRLLAAYDPQSYFHNFDDGRWREEEDEYYQSRSFAQRFGISKRLDLLITIL